MVNYLTLSNTKSMDNNSNNYSKWFKKLSKKYGEDIVQDAYIIHNKKYGVEIKDYALWNKIAHFEWLHKRKQEKTKGLQPLDYIVTEEGDLVSLPLLHFEQLPENQIHLEDESAEDIYKKDIIKMYQILNFLNMLDAKASSMFLLYSLSNLNMTEIGNIYDTDRQTILRNIHQISKDINHNFESNHFKVILSGLRSKINLPEIKDLLQKLLLNNDKISNLILLNIFRPLCVLKYKNDKWCSELSEGVYLADTGQLFINSTLLTPVLTSFNLEQFTYGIFTDIIDSIITFKLSDSSGK